MATDSIGVACPKGDTTGVQKLSARMAPPPGPTLGGPTVVAVVLWTASAAIAALLFWLGPNYVLALVAALLAVGAASIGYQLRQRAKPKLAEQQTAWHRARAAWDERGDARSGRRWRFRRHGLVA